MAIDVPVKGDDGAVTGVLSMHPGLASFDEIIERQNLPKDWQVAILDRRGTTIARFPNGEGQVGDQASDRLLSALRSQREGAIENVSPGGIPLLSAFSRGERFDWVVAIGVPRTDLTGPVIKNAVKTSITGVTFLLLGVLLAFYAARRIAGPIDSLRRFAAAGDRDTPPLIEPTGLPEVDEVAAALRMAEERRRLSQYNERALRDGIETMPEGFVMYDAEDRLVMCNESYRQFYPETADEMRPGSKFEDILRIGIAHGRYPAAVGHEEEWIAERVRRQRDASDTVEQPVADGRWVLVTKHSLPNGWVAGLRVDITALKSAEESLRASEEQLRRAQRLAHVGSIFRNLETGEVEWSDEACRIFGVARETWDPTPENFLAMIHPEDREKVAALLDSADSATPLEFRIVRPDGGVRYVYRENELIKNVAGKPLYLAETIQDVTERWQTESQLQQAQKMEAIGNLTGGMAHDFNNLSGVIVGNLELARATLGEDEELREVVGEALEAAWRGADLTRRLLAFARRQPLRRRPDRAQRVGH